MTPPDHPRVRIDKWLWAARFFKTRAGATEAVLAGHVRLAGERIKPAKDVHVGDSVEVRVGETAWTLVVRGLAEKRGPARVAATLFEETAESVERRAAERLRRSQAPDAAGPRPTKRDRRQMQALRWRRD